jgi:CheY-like chemotaxis protein
MKNGLPFTILMVDDDEDDREIMDEAFREIGYEAEAKKFIEGKALLRYLEQIDPSVYPSLIVLDNTLPGIEVQEILSILKGKEQYKSIAVVVYSGSVSKLKKEQLLQMGVYAVIEKGSTMQNVVEIAKHLKSLAERGKEERP